MGDMENLETGALRYNERKNGQKNSERTYGDYAEPVSSLFFDDPFVFEAEVLQELNLKPQTDTRDGNQI